MPVLKKQKTFDLERTYAAPVAAVWRAWTEPDLLARWWGPDKTFVPECTLDLRVGGEIALVMEAGPEMGRYAGTRWPMAGTFTEIEEHARLVWSARSWTDGKDDVTTIEHVNTVTFTEVEGGTHVRLDVAISAIGAKARMAAFGMKWGYKAQLGRLDGVLEPAPAG
ncbi:SRPBCC domain-containing protein [Nocardioides sp. GY 10127]|uniref:SRPBCC family protein n=1 Tax=Nocardioides sp. GY 10127 TaxID=2569762 RepID=UPI0010A7C934|nr:SRPBCC domain-containing protein [Nocardioides sp. GY 10127]TIC80157.1 SRPBCC domain-containing protein [Nocardioides sp. GY 10127]